MRISFLFWGLLGLLFYTCQNNSPVRSDATKPKPPHSLRLSSDSANAQINRWDKKQSAILHYLQSQDPSDTILAIRGFLIPPDEFQQMLDSLGQSPQVWAMLALQPDPDSLHTKRKVRLGLIFKGKRKKQGLTNGDGFEYFDFTDPCPPCDGVN